MVSEDLTIRFLEQLSSTGQLIMDRRLIKITGRLVCPKLFVHA